jgi:hypothetical protein
MQAVGFSLLSKPSTRPALGVTCVEEIRSENAISTGSSLKEFCGKSAELETFFSRTTHFLHSSRMSCSPAHYVASERRMAFYPERYPSKSN